MAKSTATGNITNKIAISENIIVGNLAERLNVPATKIIEILMKHKVLATINETIDFATAKIAAKELGIQITRQDNTQLSGQGEENNTGKTSPRAPVVAFMGHVDHGKTSLLDKIRSAEVVKDEAGGITQHLSAYQIVHSERKITLIDTPGHEAFVALRQHGTRLIDLAVIVIAADSGVQPQTKEAINFVQKAGVKVIVAINKSDLPTANSEKVKKELADLNLNPEEWGGDTVVVEVSAKTGKNIDKLLDMILLVADIEELVARDSGLASGMIIESHMEKGHGAVATVLIEAGKLVQGDFLTAGSAYGKAKTLRDTLGENISEAGPSTPVVIAGWKSLPNLGAKLKVVENERIAKTKIAEYARNSGPKAPIRSIAGEAELSEAMDNSKTKSFPMVLKADTQGSLDAILDSLKSIDSKHVNVKVLDSKVGHINESDVTRAASGSGQIIGFNVNLPTLVKQLADRAKVKVSIYKVIYELIDDIKQALEALLEPEIVETKVGELEVKGVFKIAKNALVCGGLVKSGRIETKLIVKKISGEESIEIGRVMNVQKEQNDVAKVVEGEMCGLNIATEKKIKVEIGDKLDFISVIKKPRKL